MKLSEAIRIGAKRGPQAFDAMFEKRPKLLGVFPRREGLCAFGAALRAAGATFYMGETKGTGLVARGEPNPVGVMALNCDLPYYWPIARMTTCTECGREDALLRTIAHLNDDHRWTREQIADWVETVESSVPLTVAI